MSANTLSARFSRDYDRIEQAIHFIQTHHQRQPSLKEIAASVHLSEYHFQRLFSRWVGISPARFLQYLTKEYAKSILARSRSLLDVTFETGLSSPGRLHDLFVKMEAVTPGEFKRDGEGIEVSYGFHDSPFGRCLVGTTGRGICGLFFVNNGHEEGTMALLRRGKERSKFKHAPKESARIIDRIFHTSEAPFSSPLHLHIKGTNFQIKVWEALLRIPAGAVLSYKDLASHLGMPRSARAVGNALAKNPVSYLIPCHRVVRTAGDTGNYLGGAERKKAMLAWEAAKWGVPTKD